MISRKNVIKALIKIIAIPSEEGRSINNRGRYLQDASGAKAAEKDLWRMRDMKTRAGGDNVKLLKLAQQMAGSIKDKDKAFRRADAASQIFDEPIRRKIVKIFKDAAQKL